MTVPLIIAAVGASQTFRVAVIQAVRSLSGPTAPPPHVVFTNDPGNVAHRVKGALAALPHDLAAQGPVPLLVVMHDPAGFPAFGSRHEGLLRAVAAELPPQVVFDVSARHCLLYADAGTRNAHYAPVFARKAPPVDTEAWAADIRAAARAATEATPAAPAGTNALAEALCAFLTSRGGDRWGLHCYTGSVVAALIADAARLAADGGNPILRAPSEHGLACAAMARWTLDRAPFLIVVTSGMVDEFRGTLANLRQAGARGFVLCADTSGGYWYPFQGTVHGDEDSREVMRARRLPVIHLDRPENLAADLAAAAAAYDADQGPVVLIAGTAVLESTAPVRRLWPATPPLDPQRRATTSAHVGDDPFDAVLELVENGPRRLLWQCGPLDTEEADLVHSLATDCGIALCDSLHRPGTVSRFCDGREVDTYLGTLGLYGFSPEVYHFLHDQGRLRSVEEQAVFFLKSRIAQVCTPFTERVLTKRLTVVQAEREADRRAPFTDHFLHGEARHFLRRLRQTAHVGDDLLSDRRQAIEAARQEAGKLPAPPPSAPMTAGYFFHRLAAVLTELITADGYTYTGVYDVGRGGISAVRNLPRTGPGFSGWYGRALMGDAMLAVSPLALTREDNLLAFIGDGAAGLVPDPVPTLVQQVCLEGHELRGNVSVFRLLNGGQSLIRTYREARRAAPSDPQMQLLDLVDDDWDRRYGPVTVRHRRVDAFDPEPLKAALLEPAGINLFSVLLAHDNEGDGISLPSPAAVNGRNRAGARPDREPSGTAVRA